MTLHQVIGGPRRRGLIVAGLIMVVLAGLLLRDPAPSQPVVVLPVAIRFPTLLSDRLLSVVPRRAGWAWVWKARDMILGTRRSVTLGWQIASVADRAAQDYARALPDAPFADPAGLRVWVVPQADWQRARRSFQEAAGDEVLGKPKMITGDGMEASLFTGSTVPTAGGGTVSVGVKVSCFPLARKGSTDLRFRATLTDLADPAAVTASGAVPVVLTNLDTSLRCQIPRGAGLVLMGPLAGKAPGKRIVVLLDPP